MINDFPVTYDYDPTTQQQFDRRLKPELNTPVYEFIAPTEYMVRPPQPPAYLFLLDVTYAAVSSGMLATAVRTIRESLDQLPDTEGRTRIGIMTFDGSLHFYSLSQGEAKMLIVADVDEVFLPSDERDLLVGLAENRAAIENLLNNIPGYYSNTQATNSALGSAISASVKLMGGIGGKVVILQSSVPSVGEGTIKPRDDSRTWGTSNESSLLKSQSTFYKIQATEASRVQICFDLFLCPGNVSMDIATIGTLARYSGGKTFFYPGFNAGKAEDAVKFASDLSTFLSKEVCFESVIRIRASQGLSVNSYYGNFFLRASDLLALPNTNPDHSYTAQILLEDVLPSRVACFQTAVLYTSCHGERRIRVINAAYPVSEIPEEIFDGVDVGAMTDLLSKMAIEKVLNGSLEEARDALSNKVIEISKCVKNLYKLGNSGQLMLPESIRLLPLLLSGLLKTVAFRSGNVTSPDLRSCTLSLMKTMSIPETLDLVYPFFFGIHSLEPAAGLPDETTGKIVLPARLPLSSEKLERHGLFVLHDGQTSMLWVGSQIHPDLCSLIFGQSFAELESGKITLPVLDNPWSQRLSNILSKRQSMHAYPPVTILVKEDADAALKFSFLFHLIEDRSPDSQPSYPQWLNHIREKAYA